MVKLRNLASLFGFNGCFGLVYDGKKYKTDIKGKGKIIVKISSFSFEVKTSHVHWKYAGICESLEEIGQERKGIDDISFQIDKGVLYINGKDVGGYIKK